MHVLFFSIDKLPALLLHTIFHHFMHISVLLEPCYHFFLEAVTGALMVVGRIYKEIKKGVREDMLRTRLSSVMFSPCIFPSA